MRIRSLLGVFCLSVVSIAWAGEKIVPDLEFKNLGGPWFLRGAKVIEENGTKFVHLEGNKETGIAALIHAPIPIEGSQQVKVSLRYRTDVAVSRGQSGAWVALAFIMAEGTTKYEGVSLPLETEWAAIEKVVDVPSGALKLQPQLRLQINETNTLDARDICIELLP